MLDFKGKNTRHVCNNKLQCRFFLPLGKAKWEAWNTRKGMSSEEAKKLYIQKANALIEAIGLN